MEKMMENAGLNINRMGDWKNFEHEKWMQHGGLTWFNYEDFGRFFAIQLGFGSLDFPVTNG